MPRSVGHSRVAPPESSTRSPSRSGPNRRSLCRTTGQTVRHQMPVITGGIGTDSLHPAPESGAWYGSTVDRLHIWIETLQRACDGVPTHGIWLAGHLRSIARSTSDASPAGSAECPTVRLTSVDASPHTAPYRRSQSLRRHLRRCATSAQAGCREITSVTTFTLPALRRYTTCSQAGRPRLGSSHSLYVLVQAERRIAYAEVFERVPSSLVHASLNSPSKTYLHRSRTLRIATLSERVVASIRCRAG